MIKKEDYQCWERFVLAVRQGKSAAVQSDERREAILAIAGFVERSYMANISGEAIVDSNLVIGNNGITAMMEESGYIGTICAQVNGCDCGCESIVQDLHVTERQLKDLRNSIGFFLKAIDDSGEEEECA